MPAPLENLAVYLRKTRLEKGLSIVAVANLCRISKQYLCDIEHGRRKLKVDTRTAAKIAACLDIPVDEITNRVDKNALTNKERKVFADYHRTMRSNVRAKHAHALMRTLISTTEELRIAIGRGRPTDKLLQVLETTVKELDSTLAYRRRIHVEKRRQEVADTRKLRPGRVVLDWDDEP